MNNTTPFSARNLPLARPIDNDFPATARVALIHLLHQIIEQEAVEGWPKLARELQRIDRIEPKPYRSSTEGVKEAENDCREIVKKLPWDKVLDFIERLHGTLVKAVGYRGDNDDWVVVTSVKESQALITLEIQNIFLEEKLAFEFHGGMVHRRGRKHTVDVIARASVVLSDPRLDNARKHYLKAVQFFRTPANPDYQNTVKEAVCAVEAAGKSLFPEAKAATLGDLVKWLTAADVKLPKSLAQTLVGLYGFRSGGEGVGHGGTSGGEVTKHVAEYVLAVSTSQIIYLIDLADAQASDLPF